MPFLDLEGLQILWSNILSKLSNKVDYVEGKQLSTNDFTNEEKSKLASLTQSDWAASENEPGHVLNRTHYDTVMTKTLYNGTINIPANTTTRVNGVPDEIIINYPDTSKIRATYDGLACTITASSNRWDFYNPSKVRVFTMYYDTEKGARCLATTAGAHTLVIETDEITAVPLDEKYIPDTIPRRVDIPHMAMPDWGAAEGEAGYVKNRTHYEEKHVIVPNTIINVPSSELYAALPKLDTALEVGSEYVVGFGNENYTCIAWKEGDVIYLGNGNIYPGNVNKGENVPFSIDTYADGTAYLNTQVGNEYVVSIGTPGIVKKLDKKFLPDEVLHTGETVAEKVCIAANNIAAVNVLTVNGQNQDVNLNWEDIGERKNISNYSFLMFDNEDALVENVHFNIETVLVSEQIPSTFPSSVAATVKMKDSNDEEQVLEIVPNLQIDTEAGFGSASYDDNLYTTFAFFVGRDNMALPITDTKSITFAKAGIYLAKMSISIYGGTMTIQGLKLVFDDIEYSWPEDTTNPIPEKYLPESVKANPNWNAVEGEAGYIENKPIIPDISNVATKNDIANLASTTYVDNKVAALVDSSPDTLNTLNELAAALGDDPNFATTIATQIGQLEESKVEKIAGKGLSTNDYTTADKTLLNTIADQYLTRNDIADLDSKIEAAHSHAVTYKGSAFANGLYKITTNAEGHVTGATAVAKADITALGIPAQDTDTGATSVEVTGAGNAITAASYDATNRKLTLTKGATYTNNQGTITGVNAGTSLSGGGTSGAISISHAEGSAINKAVGLYKFATDATSHVKSVTAVNKADIVALGIPAQDTTYSAITNNEIDAICGQL